MWSTLDGLAVFASLPLLVITHALKVHFPPNCSCKVATGNGGAIEMPAETQKCTYKSIWNTVPEICLYLPCDLTPRM